MDRYSTVPPRIRYSARGSGVYRWASPFRLSEFQRREGRGHGVRSCTGSRPLGRAHPHGYLDRSGLIVEIFFRGALMAFGLFPIVALLFHQSWLFVLFAFLVAILIWSKHTDNLVRLWMGTERRIGDRPSDQVAPR